MHVHVFMCVEDMHVLLYSNKHNLFFTVQSFTRYMFTLPEVTTFLSEKLSQDPLEQFFGCQR